MLKHTPGRNFSDLQVSLLLEMKYLLSQKLSLSGTDYKVVVVGGRPRNEKKDCAAQLEGKHTFSFKVLSPFIWLTLNECL